MYGIGGGLEKVTKGRVTVESLAKDQVGPLTLEVAWLPRHR